MQAAATQLKNQDVREWARDNGWEVSDLGRLPAGVVAAYEAAHPDEDDGDSGPDFMAAAAALGVIPGSDPLANDDPDPEDMPGEGGSSGSTGEPSDGQESTLNDAPAGQPTASPVRSLADARARAAAQPKRPAWATPGRGDRKQQGSKTGKGSTARGRPAPPPEIDVTPAVLDDMQGKVAMLLAIPGATWEMVDPECGGTFNDELPNISAKLVPVLAKSQAVVRLLTQGDTWIALLGLAVAMKPVAMAVYDHHLSEDAQKARHLKRQGWQQGGGQPAAQQEDLSAYEVNPVVTGHVPQYRYAG